MKITNQSIPPELAAAYAELVCTKATGAGDTFTTRTKKAVHKPARKRPKSRTLMEYEKAVDFLIAFLKEKTGNDPAPTFRNEQIKKLKKGVFDDAYWISCTIESEQVLLTEPTFSPWVGPRNYAYPDPSNQPTVPLYLDGNNSSGALDYVGYTAGTEFRDVSLKWRRTVFELANPFLTEAEEPVFLTMVGTITASADYRPSRAMISAVIQRFFVVDGSATLSTMTPPLTEPISAIYRYRTPHGIAPYFNYTNPLRLIYSARSRKYEEITGTLKHCVVLAAPMPMMGKRYNNNTTVTTSLSPLLALWQIKKTEIVIVGYSRNPIYETAFYYTRAVGMLSLGTLGGNRSRALAVSADGRKIAGHSEITGNLYNHAFMWTQAQGMVDLGTLGGLNSYARSISSDGLTVVGDSQTTDQTQLLAFIWTQAQGMFTIGTLGGRDSSAFDVSADGIDVVGESFLTGDTESHAFVWTQGIGMIDLGSLGGIYSGAYGISEDGYTIVGWSLLADNESTRAFMWTPLIGMFDLGTLGGSYSEAHAVSADGSVIVGFSFLTGDALYHAFIVRNGGGMLSIGTLGGSRSFASGVSADGLTVVGRSQIAGDTATHAFSWTEAGGMVDLGTLGGTFSQALGVN